MRRLKKIIFASVFFSLTTACTHTAVKQAYRPASSIGASWVIDGTIAMNKATIFVNGEKVIQGFALSDNLRGNYDGKEVKANCKHHVGFVLNHWECDVYVSREFATTLVLR